MDSMPRKYPWHDFRRAGHYLLTLKAASRGRDTFAHIDSSGGVHATPLGDLVRTQWNKVENETNGSFVTHAFQLMPDHIHAQVEIISTLPKPIGYYIARFKALVTGTARRKLTIPKDLPLWESDYDWRKKTTGQEVAIARQYVESNPAQHILKSQAATAFGKAGPIAHPRLPPCFPDEPADREALSWKAFGNPKLLDGRLWPLRVSRRASASDIQAMTTTAIEWARTGRIAISPAISPGEKAIFQAIVKAGGNAIHLATVPLTPCYHPASWAMEAFAQGRFLVLSPVPDDGCDRHLSRIMAEHLNACALAIAQSTQGESRGTPARVR